MQYLGDITEDATIDFKFPTQKADGTPITLAGSPTVAVYKANGASESTAGVTLTVDFDSRTGCHHVRIDTSADAFYATGNDYQVVLTAGTVNSVSVAGAVLAQFSIENRNIKANVTHFGGAAGAFSGGRPGVNATHWDGTAVASAAVRANAIQFAGQTITCAAGVTVYAHVGTAAADTAQTGDAFARLGSDGAGLTAIPWNAAWNTEVQSECEDALAIYDGPTKAEQDAAFAEIKGAGWSSSTDTLELIRDASGGGGLDAAGVRAAIGLAAADLDLQLASKASQSTLVTVAGYLDTEIAAILEDTGITLPALIAALSIPSAATNASAVRTELATELARIDVETSTRLASGSYTAPLDAAGIRTAIGLGAANLDTQLAAIDSMVDAILADTGTDGVVLSSATRDAIAASLLDLSAGVQTDWTLRQALRIILAAVAGKISGADTSTVTIRDVGDTKDRIVASVAASGRTSVVYDKT